MTSSFKLIHNGDSLPLIDVPLLAIDDLLQTIIDSTDRGWRVSSFFADPYKEPVPLYCILSSPRDEHIGIMRTVVDGKAFPSIAAIVPQVHLFEREIAEQTGLRAEGHPWFKPVRFHHSYRKGVDAWQRDEKEQILPGVMDYYRVEGDEIHEVAVGPVHAGVIEPGHFRFQCHGEHVYHLEISLGYQHRGLEAQITKGPNTKTLYQMEAAAGDTTIAHAQAYSMVLESLAGCHVRARAEMIRSIALELERLANHTGDLGAIAGDIGYLPTSSFCGRIRGDFLNMTAVICGSRFGRGLIRPGGTGFDLNDGQVTDLKKRLEAAGKDLKNAVGLMWTTPSVMARLEDTGIISRDDAVLLGLVGPAARACGLSRDIRQDHPFGIYRMSHIPAVTAPSGDVYSRTLIRWLECERSLDFIDEQLSQLPAGECRTEVSSLAAEQISVAMTEGWRGEICHVGITDASGQFARYKITDPSFHNWTGLAMALRNGQISDFPLCNKSFNLSYCGFDL